MAVHVSVTVVIRDSSTNYTHCKLGGALARVGKRRSVYRVLVGKPEGKSPLGRPRLRWDYTIFKKYDVGVWTGLIWLRIETGGGHL
jgi:hypothetical protein